LWHPRYEIRGKDNDAGLFPANERELLPHLEWAVNWQIALYFKGYLQVHASAVELNGRTILFPGSPGSGKTTICAGLLSKGARYFSDEFALIEPRTLRAHPYPKALCIKESSIKVLEEACPYLRFESRWIKKTKGVVAFLDPWQMHDHPIAQPAKIDFVIFPTFLAQATAELLPVSKAEVAFNLNKHSLNFLDFREQGIDILADIASSAPGFSLRMGNLEPTCQLITDLVSNGVKTFGA
jgi:HprK-related kinase A